MAQINVFATNGSGYLADDIRDSLKKRLPKRYQVKRSIHTLNTFSNGNILASVPNVRGAYCVVVHTQVPPVHTNLFELLSLLDSIYNAEPDNILLVFPYMPYVRSDRKNKPRISTMSVILAHTINRVCGVNKVLLMEPHDGHIKHYFEPQAQEISTMYLLAAYLKKEYLQSNDLRKKSKIVFPDAGAAKRYKDVANMLDLRTAYIDKDRPNDDENPDFHEIVGKVNGFICFIIDDECLTGGTIIGDAENLIRHGASEVIVVVTHPIFNDNNLPPDGVINKLEASQIKKVIATNSIPIAHKIAGKDKFVVISVDQLIAEAIKRIILKQSVSILHDPESVNRFKLL